jgi:RNA polymerase sigma factor (sigma-70 family)
MEEEGGERKRRRSWLVGDDPPGDVNELADTVLVMLILLFLAEDDGRAWEPFEALYRRHVQGVLNTVYRFLLNHYHIRDYDLAWQVTGDTFLRAWDRLPRKNPEAPFGAWVKVIGIHVAQEQMRSVGQPIPLDSNPPDDPNLLEESPEDQLLEFLSRAALENKVKRVKMRLSERQQAAFDLHFGQGYKPREIAEALGIKPASARQLLWRAIAQFRAEWAQDKGEPMIPVPIHLLKRGRTSGSQI